jgi:flagellar secretion chaperone FliS
MYGSQGVRRYRETDLGTMTREKMVVLLYEKVISDLEEAMSALASGDRPRFTQRVNHSQRIIAELRSALDHAAGGEIARNLEAIYDFVFREHLSLLVDREPRRARACIDILRPLLEAWRQLPQALAEGPGRTQGQTGSAGADPAPGNGTGQLGGGGLAAAPRPGLPELAGTRPSLLSVSA